MQVTDPYLRERLLRPRGPRQPAAAVSLRSADWRRWPPRCRPSSSWSPTPWGRPSCWITRTDASRASCSKKGSPTAHVAIVARAFDIPVVGRVAEATQPDRGGRHRHRRRRSRPGADPAARRYPADRSRRRSHARTRRRAYYETLRDAPAVTRDGVAVKLLLNAGPAARPGAAGGNRRRGRRAVPHRDRRSWRATPFPTSPTRPRFTAASYEQAAGRPIVFRTLDIGGDKVLPYLPHAAEDNPAMGWRAIRIGLDRPAMLRQQLRALLRAAAGRELLVKFPMIAEVAELERGAPPARRRSWPALPARVERPRSVKVGVMLEVPSLLWQLPALLPTGRFSVDRHQRSGPVPLCLRPRQSAPRRALRSVVGADAGAVPRR